MILYLDSHVARQSTKATKNNGKKKTSRPRKSISKMDERLMCGACAVLCMSVEMIEIGRKGTAAIEV